MDDKVVTKLPIPTVCDCCQSSNVKFIVNKEIYGREYGTWPYGYYCFDCKAYVGCHPNTNIPLGEMASSRKRQLRSKLHGAFDLIWKSGYMSRTEAYDWLAVQLNIPSERCHISWLTYAQLKSAIEICTEVWPGIEKIMERRNKKRYAKHVKRNERYRSTLERRKHCT